MAPKIEMDAIARAEPAKLGGLERRAQVPQGMGWFHVKLFSRRGLGLDEGLEGVIDTDEHPP